MRLQRARHTVGGPSGTLGWAVVRLLPMLALLLFVSYVIDPGRPFTGDEQPLLAAAGRILHGRYAVVGTLNPVDFLWHGPGLPALLAPLVALGVPLAGLRLTTPLLMFAAVVMFYRLLSRRLRPRPALAGAYALGLYVPSYYVLGTVAKEPLALLLAVLALDATARYVRTGRRRLAMVAGLSLGALAMTRLEYGVVIAVLLVGALMWSLAARLRHGTRSIRDRVAARWTAVCGIAMTACLPWLAYTYALTGRVFYWGNAGGLSLYWMSSPSPSQLGQWHSPRTVLRDPSLVSYRPLFHHLAKLPPLRADLALQHLAITQALGHPAKYALNILANIGRMLVGFPFSFTLSAAAIGTLIAINGALLAGLILAIVKLRRRRSSLPRETLPFALFGAVGFAIHLFPTAEPRMLVPIIPIPIWFIGQALNTRRLSLAPVQAPVARPSPARHRAAALMYRQLAVAVRSVRVPPARGRAARGRAR